MLNVPVILAEIVDEFKAFTHIYIHYCAYFFVIFGEIVPFKF